MVEIYTSAAQKRGDPVDVVNFLHRCPFLLRSCALLSPDKNVKEDLEFLLGYGLDIDEHDDKGENLLDVSLSADWLFRYLLSKGANINATNQNGQTVLDREKNVSTKDWLIRHGALPGSQLEKAVGN
jgi:ankyrin repeat protein